MSKTARIDNKVAITRGSEVVFFITVLRALAACTITNAHYTDIYPTDLIANGGLIGDVLFFAVSGYCLYNVKYAANLRGFAGWYGKRIWRVYPPVLIMTGIYMLLGAYSLSDHSVVWWYIYPTYYHFVASIIVLYITFFVIMKIEVFKRRIISIMIGLAVAWMLVYIVFYDKSYYHIDTVREPMVRFLFMESMLLGAYFRQKDRELRNKFKAIYPIIAFTVFLVYFASKLAFSHIEVLSLFQFLNQITIFIFLYFLFRTFCSIDNILKRMPGWLKCIVSFLSEMTLEIYVVQYAIIEVIRNLDLFFPLNWIMLTAAIIISAFILHIVCDVIYKGVDKIITKKQ